MRRWEVAIPAVSIARAVSIMPPPSLLRAEYGEARGNAILAVLVLEAVVVVALDVLEKFRACGGTTAPSFSSSAPTNGVTTTLPGGKDICADICRYLPRYLVTPADIWSRRKDILQRNQYKS